MVGLTYFSSKSYASKSWQCSQSHFYPCSRPSQSTWHCSSAAIACSHFGSCSVCSNLRRCPTVSDLPISDLVACQLDSAPWCSSASWIDFTQPTFQRFFQPRLSAWSGNWPEIVPCAPRAASDSGSTRRSPSLGRVDSASFPSRSFAWLHPRSSHQYCAWNGNYAEL